MLKVSSIRPKLRSSFTKLGSIWPKLRLIGPRLSFYDIFVACNVAVPCTKITPASHVALKCSQVKPIVCTWLPVWTKFDKKLSFCHFEIEFLGKNRVFPFSGKSSFCDFGEKKSLHWELKNTKRLISDGWRP